MNLDKQGTTPKREREHNVNLSFDNGETRQVWLVSHKLRRMLTLWEGARARAGGSGVFQTNRTAVDLNRVVFITWHPELPKES